MFDLKIIYLSGAVEYKAPQTPGISFGGGCVMQSAFVSVDDMDSKGIRASLTYYKPFEQEEETMAEEIVLIAPEHLPRVFMILDNERLFMCRDDAGRLLNPVETQIFVALEEKS